MAEPVLHVQRIGDEVLVTIRDEGGSTVVALPVPDGVEEFVVALQHEASLPGVSRIADEPGWYRSRLKRSPFSWRWKP